MSHACRAMFVDIYGNSRGPRRVRLCCRGASCWWPPACITGRAAIGNIEHHAFSDHDLIVGSLPRSQPSLSDADALWPLGDVRTTRADFVRRVSGGALGLVLFGGSGLELRPLGAEDAAGATLRSPNDVLHFRSRPDLRPPRLTVLRSGRIGSLPVPVALVGAWTARRVDPRREGRGGVVSADTPGHGDELPHCPLQGRAGAHLVAGKSRLADSASAST